MATRYRDVKPRNYLITDLMSSKYRMRVVDSKKDYNRQVEKQKYKKELVCDQRL